MRFDIDPGASEPPFEQVRAQVVAAVRDGALTPGEKLPTVRALAGDLGLAVNTVAKAYRALEHDAIIETRGRSGTFVAPQGDTTQQSLQTAAAEYAALARRLGRPADEALAAVEAALRIGTG
ncbi:GntR family transcriptional regulator [Agromyces aerolatus]|uniref:GntR family transcriptional regulator n=1 Tax=Agromyces sp. LY-1074 TaxID=3074080 RepID=UPI0028595021|nr:MULTISPECIES: GntR family transcriptional regulator [unclassified Agromyces]MDR5700576.1 GntR family transcriptional regulator [Agromyces sp. LY-1074]MDR5707097.1 GntR family transcriptional regulator [Agromyces sp. LY-1358]